MLLSLTLLAQLSAVSAVIAAPRAGVSPAQSPPVRSPIACVLTNGDRLTGSLRFSGRTTIRVAHASLGVLTVRRRAVRWCESADTAVLRRMRGLALRPSIAIAGMGDTPLLTPIIVPTPEPMVLLAERPFPKEALQRKPVVMPLASSALPTYVAKVGWKRQLALSYALARGNASTSDLGFTGSATRRFTRSQLSVQGKRRHGVRNGTVAADFFSTILRYDLALGPNDAGAAMRPSFFSESVYERDPIARIQRRWVQNTGLSIPLSPDPKNNLALEVGAGVTQERRTDGDHSTRGSGLLRLAAKQQLGIAKSDQQVAAFPELGGADHRYRLNTDLNFAAPINKILALRLGFTHRYNTRPQALVKKSDVSMQTGLGFEF